MFKFFGTSSNPESGADLVEELKKEIVSLKIRLRRLEDFIGQFPNPDDYLSKDKISFNPNIEERDELFETAVRMLVQHDMASASLIQRRLQIGFNRAAILLEQLEEAGAVGPADGSKPRKVLVKSAKEFLENIKSSE